MLDDGPLVFVDIDTQRDFLDPAGALYIAGSDSHHFVDRIGEGPMQPVPE